MKILLIDPPYTIFTGYISRYFPVGLTYIAAVLRENGNEVVIYEADKENAEPGDLNFSEEYRRLERYRRAINNDAHFIWKKIGKLVDDFKPDIIGITSMTMTFGSVVKTAEICKKTNPGIKVIIGGPHATDWPEMCFQSPYIDVVLSGESEEIILMVIEALKKDSASLAMLPGVSCRTKSGVILKKESPYISDLDHYPHPARELLSNQNQYTSEDMGVIMTSRGCPYKCGFCSHHQKVRYRNLDNVIREIKDVMGKYGTRQFAIKDDSFTVSRKRTIDFCAMVIKEGLSINWDCTTRVNLIDEELIELMKKAGCNTVKVGIETGSERILKEINKGVTFEQMREAAKILNKQGMFWSAYFIYGFPTETKEDMLKTVEFMEELNPPYASTGIYAPLPNTSLWNQALELGLVDSDIAIEHFFTTNPKDYFFKDYKRRVTTMDYDEFSQLAAHVMNAFNKHNTHWAKLLKRGWSRRNVYKKDPKLLIGDINKAMKWLIN